MNISRSGYYKWRARKGIPNQWEVNRKSLSEEIKKVHEHHSTYGYRHIAQKIRNTTGEVFSDLLCHKICKELKIRSKARKTWVKSGMNILNIQMCSKATLLLLDHSKRLLRTVQCCITMARHMIGFFILMLSIMK